MSSSFGNALRVQIFGQSHSPAIGCVVEGLPAGVPIDLDELQGFLDRRAPGKNAWSTPRKEADRPRVVGGLNERGETCGAPFAALIENTNTRSRDYDELRRVPRPGHADFVAWEKWGDAHDVSGGGHFSGRLTAPICLAGAICLQILAERGIRIGAHLASVAGMPDEPFSALDTTLESSLRLAAQLDALADGRDFPVIDADSGTHMVEE
ncbi:MAG: chorismate synthase, partial [Atopobiaceae bacterium]|nr:chorismate synthase [Atopobiaceae bacterium]